MTSLHLQGCKYFFSPRWLLYVTAHTSPIIPSWPMGAICVIEESWDLSKI
jgi:hypothetical protein